MSSNTEMRNNTIKMIMDQCINRDGSERIQIDLGIEKVCDIPVNVILRIFWSPEETHPRHAIMFIDAQDIWVTENDDIDKHTLFRQPFNVDKTILPIENVANFLQSVAQILNKIVFDKCIGEFILPESPKKNAAALLFCEEFGVTNPAVKTKLYTCCVCYDKTITRTSCDHVLCIPCWSSIKRTDDAEDCCDSKKCPICREQLYI